MAIKDSKRELVLTRDEVRGITLEYLKSPDQGSYLLTWDQGCCGVEITFNDEYIEACLDEELYPF